MSHMLQKTAALYSPGGAGSSTMLLLCCRAHAAIMDTPMHEYVVNGTMLRQLCIILKQDTAATSPLEEAMSLHRQQHPRFAVVPLPSAVPCRQRYCCTCMLSSMCPVDSALQRPALATTTTSFTVLPHNTTNNVHADFSNSKTQLDHPSEPKQSYTK